jgi:hypothetical protein
LQVSKLAALGVKVAKKAVVFDTGLVKESPVKNWTGNDKQEGITILNNVGASLNCLL